MKLASIQQRERRLRKKKYLVSLLGGSCILCGKSKPLGELHFHHIDPTTKSFDIGININNSLGDLVAEVQKCALLCNNCHSLTHLAMRTGNLSVLPNKFGYVV